MQTEPDNEALLVSRVKTQNKEQKAQQSYESNMDVQGFGSTFAGGFYQTASSGFGAAASRPQSAHMKGNNDSRLGQPSAQPLMTENGDDEDERRAQEEFE